MRAARVLYYVQYLLGIGHVRRSALIVRALANSGVDVHVAFGGVAVPHIDFSPATVHQLTPLRSADAGFSGLVDASGEALDKAGKQARTEQLITLAEKCQADLIVTETFPFGRRQMRFELRPLLKWANDQDRPPVLVSSIRDILQQRSDKRIDECLELVKQHYHYVLAHGDANFVPLEASFPRAAELADKLHYSGYVCPNAPASVEREARICVSIGGGSVGQEIIQTALALYQSGFASDCKWQLICGPNMPEAQYQTFLQHSAERLEVCRLADDFLASLSRARVSISMAGYNTVMDLLATQTPSVVIPFEGEAETEQLHRAKLLAEGGQLQLVREHELSIDSLRSAIEQALSSTGQNTELDSQGAQHSAALLKRWAEENMADD